MRKVSRFVAVAAVALAGLAAPKVGAARSVEASFNPARGTLVAAAFDPAAQNVFIFASAEDQIREFGPSGTLVDSIPRPGGPSDDFDMDFIEETITLGPRQAQVPQGSLLVANGDDSPETIYALNKDDGTVLASVTLESNNAVGLTYDPGDNALYVVDWVSDIVISINPQTGKIVRHFTVAPDGSPTMTGGARFEIHYGDLDVNPTTGNLFVAGSVYPIIRELSPLGAFVRDIDLSSLQLNGGISGLAFDSTGDLWVTTTTGWVYKIDDLFTDPAPQPPECNQSNSICTDDEDDEVEGTSLDDFIYTAGGNDLVQSGAGNDTVDAGGGDDEVAAGPGMDHVLGGLGNDTIFGDAASLSSWARTRQHHAASADMLEGGGGRDLILGEAGDDTLKGGSANDRLRGGPGKNVMIGGPGTDTCYGDKNDKFRSCERQRRSLG